MAVKSVIDVEVNDKSFKSFSDLFSKYKEQLKSTPAAWANVEKAIKGSRVAFDEIVADMAAANVKAKLLLIAQEKADNLTSTTSERWSGMAKSSLRVADNVRSISGNIAKWASLIGITGLLGGAAGLFGLEHLGDRVTSGRRASGGLGVGYGQRQSFGLNFQRFVDPEQLLGGVSGAKADVTSQGYVALLASGITSSFLQSHNAAEVSSALLKQIPRLFGGTPEPLISPKLKALGLDQFLSQQDVRRYLAASPQERARQEAHYKEDSSDLNLSERQREAWNDFTTQLHRAGAKIDNVFISGLTPLTRPLTNLSEAFVKATKSVLESPKIGEWIKKLSGALERFAKYITTDDFEKSVVGFVDNVAKLAKFFGWLVGITGDFVAPSANAGTIEGSGGGRAINNPGNLRVPGSPNKFQQFATPAEGLRAMSRQLQLYQSRDHLDTIRGIVSKYAPPEENDTEAYIADVAKRTGFSENKKLNLSDPNTMSELISAMTRHENKNSGYTPGIVIHVINEAGGSLVTSGRSAGTP